MKTARPSYAAAILLLVAPVLAQAPGEATGVLADPPPGLELIQKDQLMAHAAYLASDELGGRLTGSVGQIEAAHYIAKYFEQLGLEPLGDVEGGKRSYFQRYPVQRTFLDPDKTVLQIGDLKIDGGYAVMTGTKSKNTKIVGKWAFLDPRGRIPNLAGAVPVVMLKTPKLKQKSVYANFGTAMRSFLKSKGIAQKFAKKGAKAVVFCVEHDDAGLADTLNYIALAPGKDLLSFDGDSGMAAMAANWKSPIPQIYFGSALSQQVLAALGADGEEGEAEPVEGMLQIAVATDKKAHALNVVACLRGSDKNLADEAVVYSAHMDHVGLRHDGEVFNGADDNASGTSGMLEIAHAFAKAGPAPRRSIVFLSVSGEELGLWGSQYFADNPTWPKKKMIADINTDMIGRSGPESEADEVTVTPSYRHPMFSTIVRDAAEIGTGMGITFVNGDKYYTRSDHYNFVKLGIPVVFFCNGEHEDYHQVTDHPEKLDGEKMETIARIAYWTGRRVADADERPEKLGRSRDWKGTPR